VIEVEDNAGNYCESQDSQGLGMHLVDRRIKSVYGNEYGLTIDCDPQKKTLVQVRLPLVKDLTDDEKKVITDIMRTYTLENDLKREVS
jgi:two-component system LytT family sensor kinase